MIYLIKQRDAHGRTTVLQAINAQDDNEAHAILGKFVSERVGCGPLNAASFYHDPVAVMLYFVEPEKTLNTMEACAILHINRTTLLRWIRRGHIHPLPGGGNKHLFAEQEVLRTLETRSTGRKLKAVNP